MHVSRIIVDYIMLATAAIMSILIVLAYVSERRVFGHDQSPALENHAEPRANAMRSRRFLSAFPYFSGGFMLACVMIAALYAL